MSKYIDLAEQIIEAKPASPNSPYADDVREILGWLDEFAGQNPDQVPGRTITHSEYRFYEDETGEGNMSVAGLLKRLGIEVVPDPEQTNAEKLADYVRQMDLTPMSPKECGKWLDEQGVKAPGGETDDH